MTGTYTYYYTLEFTAAYGGTIFWKLTDEFKVGGTVECH